jgi:hypothetical protein
MEKEKKRKGNPPSWAASGSGRLSLPRARTHPPLTSRPPPVAAPLSLSRRSLGVDSAPPVIPRSPPSCSLPLCKAQNWYKKKIIIK